MPRRSALSVCLLAFYLLVAGGLPLADALLERAAAHAVAQGGQNERGPRAPHDESCPLCVLLDRIASAEAGAPLQHASGERERAVRWSDAWLAPPLVSHRAFHARAPPAI